MRGQRDHAKAAARLPWHGTAAPRSKFADRPDAETLLALFDEAKRTFATLYPDIETDNFAVTVHRLRQRDLLPGNRESRTPPID
jgi:hypothetical protein